MMCDCKYCQRFRIYQECIQRVPENDKIFWECIMDELYEVEHDLCWANAVIDGQWENADTVIQNRRNQIKEKQCASPTSPT